MGATKALREAAVVAWINGWIALRRGWVWVVAGSMSPLSFLVILAIYGGVGGLRWGLLGGLLWTLASNGISLIGDATYYRLGIRYQSMLVASPVSPLGYAVGLALSSFVFASPALAAYVAAMAALGVAPVTPLSAPALFLLWLASAGIGFTASTFIRHLRYAWSLPQILSTVFTVAAPVYYPATSLPSPYLGALLPTGAAAVIAQHEAGLHSYSPDLLAACWLSLALYASLGLLAVARVARWRQP